MNLAYAVLAESAEADDRAEMATLPHLTEESRANACRNRAELDVWLLQPIGRLAVGEERLIRELGGVA